MLSLKDFKVFEDATKDIVNINEENTKKLFNGEEVEIGPYIIRYSDEGDENIHTLVELGIDESILFEKRVRQTKRMQNSNKVVTQVTKDLFGPDGKYAAQVKKIFKLFKAEMKKKSKDMGVPISNVRDWKITLKDFSSPDIGNKI